MRLPPQEPPREYARLLRSGTHLTPSARGAADRFAADEAVCAGRTAPLGRLPGVSRYRLAGEAAKELIEILGAKPTEDNRRLWAYYCYHHDIETILEEARTIASRHRQGELKWPIRKFQSWLNDNYGKEAK